MTGILNVLLGQQPYDFTLSGAEIADGQVGPSSASASLVVRSDGTVDSVTNTNGTIQLSADTDWIIPNQYAPGGSTPLGMGLQVQATLQSGDTPTGTLGSALALTEDRTWTLSQSGTGSKSCTLLVEILAGPNNTVFASNTYDIEASVA